MTESNLTEQANTGDLVEQRIERCGYHGTWALIADGCTLCMFEKALHPAGSARAA